MGLRQIIPILVLVIQLYGTSIEAANLPKLQGNKLLTGPAREKPGAKPIECGARKDLKGKVKTLKNPSQVLNPATFKNTAFSAASFSSMGAPQPQLISKFKYAEIKGGKKNIQTLVLDDKGESAYWLPQGGHIDIPKIPKPTQPHYVFTPDYSGCSWTVTPMSNGNLRLRHVEGSHCEDQFNNLSTADKGGSTSYALQYRDYGYVEKNHKLVSNVQALAYMHFTGGRWTMHVQQKTCAPETGSYKFDKKKKLTELTMTEWKSDYPNVFATQDYTVPTS